MAGHNDSCESLCRSPIDGEPRPSKAVYLRSQLPNIFYATRLYVRVDPRIQANSTRPFNVPVTVRNVTSCSELQECDLPSTHREDGDRPQSLVNTSLLWDTGRHAPNDDVLDFVGPRLYSYMRATTLAA